MINNINFDHTVASIQNDYDSVIYEKLSSTASKWTKHPLYQHYYRFTDLKCVPNIWRTGNIYNNGFCVQNEIDGRQFICIQANNSTNTPLFINNELNTQYWREYSDIISRIVSRSIIGEYETYYNYLLCSESFDKAVKYSELKEITEDRRSRKYLTGSALNEYLYSLKGSPWTNVGLNIQHSTTYLHTSHSWSIYALNQTSKSEHCLQQEIKVNPNEFFNFSAYAMYENSKDIALAITFRNESSTITYVAFYDVLSGEFIKTEVLDNNYNQINDPLIIENFSAAIENTHNEEYRLSVSGKFNSTDYQPNIICKIMIPSTEGEIYYNYSTQKSILINCAQFIVQQRQDNSYKYIETNLVPTKGSILSGLFYKTPDDRIVPYEEDYSFHFGTELPNTAYYTTNDLFVLSNGISFPDGIKMGQREDDLNIDKTLTYWREDKNEYHQTRFGEKYRLLSDYSEQWKMKMVDALTFNKFGYERFAGQQYKK